MKTVLLTGATGAMGTWALKALVNDQKKNFLDSYKIRVFIRNTRRDRKIIRKYRKLDNFEIVYGDIVNYDDVYNALVDIDMVLHVAAFVSPQADYYPEVAMKVNYGGTKNIVDAIVNLGNKEKTKLVFIGTIAQTGDRMPPIHWGRVGDPIKTSIYDYYAVSKVAAERYVIESELKNWVSLRQTGIIGKDMFKKSKDPILFHNGLNNCLEYISDRDSGRMLSNLWNKDLNNDLAGFWNHVYNIGGGSSARVDTITLYENVYKALGIKNMKYVINPKFYATQNFHGTYYLDSDKLNNFLDFRRDSIEYFYNIVRKELGFFGWISRVITKLPFGERFIGFVIRSQFKRTAKKKFGTINFINTNKEDRIDAYFGSRELYEKIPVSYEGFSRFKEWDKIINIDHGYDEAKPEAELNIEDMKEAIKFRGGKLISKKMVIGDWKTKLKIKCAFGHTFSASPRLILEGGHWCSVCESESWNYEKRSLKDKFFAQVYKIKEGTKKLARPIKKKVNQDNI